MIREERRARAQKAASSLCVCVEGGGAQRTLAEWAGRSCREAHRRCGDEGCDPGALQWSAFVCCSRENWRVKIKRPEGGCSTSGRVPPIPRVCRGRWAEPQH